MRIGVFINSEINFENGGSASYIHRLISILDEYNFDNSLQIIFIFRHTFTNKLFRKEVLFLAPFLKEYYRKFNKKSFFTKKLKDQNEIKESVIIEKILKENFIDIIYYPTCESFVLNYPYILTSWDVGHRSTYAFPELTLNNSFEDRNFFTKNAILKSFAVFVESEQSKSELKNYFKVFQKKIFVLPLFPSEVIFESFDDAYSSNFLKIKGLEKEKFFFYPAQFWAHKNHYGLVQAFKKVHAIHPSLKLVFCGSDKGNLSYVMDEIEKNNMSNSILNLGFISNKDLFYLYKNCISLVYPSFLGPTNMPPLEAMILGCRITCSNLEGHISSLGENALYFDPINSDEIFDSMLKVMTLTKPAMTNTLDNNYYAKLIEQYFLEILPIRKTFGLNFNQF
jgi:glycosyltransferase involved in cell wall biosynthesis